MRRRKIDPIYAAIDGMHWKVAVKLCEKKDVKEWELVKALRAHALERLGRSDEAYDLLTDVKRRHPTDSSVLSALTCTLILQERRDEADECYRNALAAEPSNLELAREVHFSYAKTFDFQRQQQLAMKMYKQVPHSHFVFWAATAMLLQVRKGGLPQMLTLGERMVKRALDAKNTRQCGAKPSAEEFRLYMSLLREQKKDREALASVIAHGVGDAPLGSVKGLSTGASKIVDETSLDATGVPSEFLMMQPTERLQLEAELRMEIADWGGAEVIWTSLVEEVPDQWSYHQGLFDATFSKASAASTSVEKEGALAPLRQHCLELQAKHVRCRSTYLAELELLKRFIACSIASDGGVETLLLPAAWRVADDSETVHDAMCGLVVSYINKFGSKLCCSADLRRYLCADDHDKRPMQPTQLLATLSTMFANTRSTSPIALAAAANATESAVNVDVVDDSMAELGIDRGSSGGGSGGPALAKSPWVEARRLQRTKQLHKHITCCQCRRYLGALTLSSETSSVDAARAEARQLVDEYRATLDVNEGATGGQREVQHGDELLLLAVHILRDIWESSMCEDVYRCQFDALLLLEYGRSCSPHNYHFKLELLDVYKELGCFAGGIMLYNQLDVKHIQLDSLSWLLFPGLFSSGFFEEAKAQCKAIMRLHKRTAADSGEFITKAYMNGNYSKAIEITEFQQQRMERSIQYALARGNYINLELQLSRHTADDVLQYLQEVVAGVREESLCLTEEELGRLAINHDWTVRLSWEPHGGDVFRKSQLAFAAMTRHLRLRMIVPRVLLACMQGETDQLEKHLFALRRVLATGAANPAAAGGSSAAGSENGSFEVKTRILFSAP
jgi:hypothetical protein